LFHEVREMSNTEINEPAETIPDKTTIIEMLKEVVGEDKVSDSELERVVYSGDPSVLPQYHYRWKKKYLADYAVRVDNLDEIEGVLRIAREHRLPVVPRGGASSCMSSSSPSRGGISLDMKLMNRILEINKEEMYVRVEPGVTFEALSGSLEKDELTLGIYPSSAKSAVIGGWIACGGRAGIGTPFYGGLKEHIVSLSVIGGNGTVRVLEGEEINLFLHSYGILGIIFEIKLKVHELASEFKSFSYGFETIDGLCESMVEIARHDKKPIYLKISDSELQKYSNPIETGKYVLTVTYIDAPSNVPLNDLKSIVEQHQGVLMDEEFSQKDWSLRYDVEFSPKEHTETLMFQEYWTPVEKVHELIKSFESYRQSHKIPALWFGMLGTQEKVRLELMAMIDAAQYLKFIASKGVLHKIMKKAIKIGGAPYTTGLQNSIYMSRAYPDRLLEMREAKRQWDPDGIMNPDRVTSCLTSFRRIDILFILAAAFRRLSRYVGK
jgi:glycolate oxidase